MLPSPSPAWKVGVIVIVPLCRLSCRPAVYHFDSIEEDLRATIRRDPDVSYLRAAGDRWLNGFKTAPVNVDPSPLVPRPAALRRDLGSRFELAKAQAIILPKIFKRLFRVKEVVNNHVQGELLHNLILARKAGTVGAFSAFF